MSARKALATQYGSTPATLIDFDQRSTLKSALENSGIFNDVRVKYDARRGHLDLFVDGRAAVTEANNVIRVADRVGFTIGLKQVSSYAGEVKYRVTSLVNKSAPVAKPAAKPVVKAKTPTLTEAIAADTKPVQATPAVQVEVFLNYERLGTVSPSVAKQIRALVEAANKPTTAVVELVELATSKKVKVTVPFDVAEAVKAQVPSFNQGSWSIKSTHGISILKENAGSPVENLYVIA